MKIGFFEIEDWQEQIFKKAFPKDQLFFSKKTLNSQNVNLYKNLEAVCVFIHSELNSTVLAKLPNLKLIATMSTGYNHIDLEFCKQKKILVCNVPTYGENTVAEQAFALILALSRKIVASVERTRKGDFSTENLRGFDLKDKTIGILGCGNIGKNVVRMAKGFGMNVIVYDVFKDINFCREMKFKYVDLNYLLGNADIITVHVPLNKYTFHLINQKNISLMKKNALLINTSRGEVIDTVALYNALKAKKILGAGLDVLERECDLLKNNSYSKLALAHSANLTNSAHSKCDLNLLKLNKELLKMPNVLITPHNAFNTQEALKRILDVTVENIKHFKLHKKINSVN